MSAGAAGAKLPEVVQLQGARVQRFFAKLKAHPFVAIVLDEQAEACRVYTKDVDPSELRKIASVLTTIADEQES